MAIISQLRMSNFIFLYLQHAQFGPRIKKTNSKGACPPGPPPRPTRAGIASFDFNFWLRPCMIRKVPSVEQSEAPQHWIAFRISCLLYGRCLLPYNHSETQSLPIYFAAASGSCQMSPQWVVRHLDQGRLQAAYSILPWNLSKGAFSMFVAVFPIFKYLGT